MNDYQNRLKLRVLALATLPLLGACGAVDQDHESSDIVGTVTDAVVTNCASNTLGPAINDHTCWHGPNGPFGDVTASTAAPGTESFSGIHKYFTVDFQDTTPSYVGYVKFTPANDDDHAIYYDPSVTVTVKNSSGTTVSPQFSKTFTTCDDYLVGYRVFPMTASGAPYSVKLQSASDTIHIALEEVSPYKVRWYQDGDSDTWGKPTPSTLTACVPPAGYTVTRGSDCNDNNASVKPTATETPGDGIDSNCNGNDNN